MKPIGPLMWEHRLIEKMLTAMMRHMDQVEKTRKVNPLVIDMAVDFIRSMPTERITARKKRFFSGIWQKKIFLPI
jgi:hemerythrin-like domain-containing protein